MASVEFINKRIAGKEKELEKLNKKLERIRKVEAQNWQDPNPYYYSAYDLRVTLRDIEEVQKALTEYKAQLVAESEKDASRNVPAIVDFLNIWRERVREYYLERLTEYYTEKQMVRDLYNKRVQCYSKESNLAYETASKAFHQKCRGYYEKREFVNRWGKQDYKEVKVKDGEYECLRPYNEERNIEDAMKRVAKDLNNEWNRKYDFIIERTNRIVGQITDASNLYVGAKQDLNGYIIGTKGVANVQTIGAGGYNIQCFHFRTLINPVK